MKIRFANAYWPNAIGAIGVMLAIALIARSCADVAIENQKTRQIEIQNVHNK